MVKKYLGIRQRFWLFRQSVNQLLRSHQRDTFRPNAKEPQLGWGSLGDKLHLIYHHIATAPYHVLQINRTTTFTESTTSSDLGFVPVADISVFHNERQFSDAEQTLLKNLPYFVCFLSFIFESCASIPSDFTLWFLKNREVIRVWEV